VRFTVVGNFVGAEASATWDDGELTGDELLVEWIRQMATAGADVAIAGVVAGPASLEDPLLARATLWSSVGAPKVLDGDEPDLEPLPTGAIP
jgi:hypothetical protein